MAERMGFEPMVRSRESLVFKTSSINHSDTSPQWLPPECRYYYTKIRRGCQPLRANFFENYFAVDLTVNFLLCFVRVVFVLGPSAIRNAKTAAVLHTAAGKFSGIILQRTGGKAVLAQHLDLRVAQLLQLGGGIFKAVGQRLDVVDVGGQHDIAGQHEPVF